MAKPKRRALLSGKPCCDGLVLMENAVWFDGLLACHREHYMTELADVPWWWDGTVVAVEL